MAYPYRLAIVHYRCYFRLGSKMVWRITSAMIDIIMCAMVQSNYGQWQQSQTLFARDGWRNFQIWGMGIAGRYHW